MKNSPLTKALNQRQERIERIFRRRVVTIDLFKHFATLSLGAIALIAGFIKSFVEAGGYKLTIVLIVLGFFVSMIASFIICWIFVNNISKEHVSKTTAIFVKISMWTTVVCFVFSVALLLYFILSNIFR